MCAVSCDGCVCVWGGEHVCCQLWWVCVCVVGGSMCAVSCDGCVCVRGEHVCCQL